MRAIDFFRGQCGKWQTLGVMLMLSLVAPVHALTLKEAVELAIGNDPVYLGAQANLNVSRERARQAVAGLLPQLNVSASTTANKRRYAPHTNPPPANIPMERYNSNAAEIKLTQPLWRHGSVIALTQANLAITQADYQLSAAAQDLLVRLAQAWFDTMQARDGLMSVDAQVQALQQRVELAQHAYDKGVLAQTDVEDARARFEQATAERAVAQSDLDIKLATLEQIIGSAEYTPPLLAEQFALPPFEGNTLDLLLSEAEAGNPTLLAAQRALDAANEEVRKQRAGHEPTLDLVASYGKVAQGAGISGGLNGFDARQGTVGLQLNLPLYAGGGQNAKVREALALQEKAAQELEAARRKVRLDAKRAWYGGRASRVRESSARQALHSGELALKGALSARSRGVKADADVLQAQQLRAVALRDWRRARYDAVVSQVKLKAASGQLNGDDLLALDQAFDGAGK